MPVVEVRPAPVDLADRECEFGLDPAAFRFEGADAVVDVGVTALHELLRQLLDRRLHHATHHDEGVSQSCRTGGA